MCKHQLHRASTTYTLTQAHNRCCRWFSFLLLDIAISRWSFVLATSSTWPVASARLLNKSVERFQCTNQWVSICYKCARPLSLQTWSIHFHLAIVLLCAYTHSAHFLGRCRCRCRSASCHKFVSRLFFCFMVIVMVCVHQITLSTICGLQSIDRPETRHSAIKTPTIVCDGPGGEHRRSC